MKNVTDIHVTQVRLFGPGVLPMGAIRSQGVRDALKESFSFESVLSQPDDGILFRNGAVSFDNDELIVISSLNFAERRLVISVEGTSESATKVYQTITDYLSQIDTSGRVIKQGPIVLTEETSCVATMGFDWSALFPGPFANLVEEDLRKIASGKGAGEATVNTVRVSVELRFETSEEIKQHSILFSNKSFTIEPSPQEPLANRRYLVKSPLDSEAHLGLLKRIERTFKTKK